jgi:uroporphyrinogen decarboxylase
VPEPLLVRAARREQVERTPVWFMRQAGRSLPEYRAIREHHGLFEIVRQPELCAEVTLQPVRRHGVDAAVIFSDIMLPALGMGIEVRLEEGVGPVVDAPIRSSADVERLHVAEPEQTVLEAIRLVRAELAPEQAVVGFVGGPFTVAGYLVEGRPSRDFTRVKELMYREPTVWHALMEKLSKTLTAFAVAQVEAGAHVIQLFDSWVGALGFDDYQSFVVDYSDDILDAVHVPTIHFGTANSHLWPFMEGDVIGVDWRVPLGAAWEQVGDRGIQGNLDPAVLLGGWQLIEPAALGVLRAAAGRPGHIFNLGHGVLPQTNPAKLTRLVELVREA